MISALKIYEDLSQTLDDKAARQIAHYLDAVYQDLRQTATKSDVAEVRTVLIALAEAQQRTESKVGELADAQRQTDLRLGSLTLKVEELADAQRQTDLRLGSLTLKVEELADAQRQTDLRLGSLTAKVEELAAAQHRTEIALAELADVVKQTRVDLKQTRVDLGGLTHTVGYRLEDESYRALPRLLQRDHGVEVTGRLVRRHLPLKAGGHIEVNILGQGRREGRPIHIVGEAKSQLHRRDVHRFQDDTLPVTQAELGEVFPVLVTYMTPEPGLEEWVRQQGIALYYSFDFE